MDGLKKGYPTKKNRKSSNKKRNAEKRWENFGGVTKHIQLDWSFFSVSCKGDAGMWMKNVEEIIQMEIGSVEV